MKKNLLYSITLITISLLLVNCKKNNADLPTECNINDSSNASVTRVSYGSESRQNYELYLPNNHNTNTPVIILVHGGAWILGPKPMDTVKLFTSDLGWNLVNPLLNQGYGVAVAKYRLACYNTVSANYTNDPMFYMKDQLADIQSIIDQLKIDAGSLSYSNQTYGLIGESAGAHISLLYALSNQSDPALKTVLSFYSPASLDEQTFKNNMSSFPFNNIPVDLGYGFGARKAANSCNLVTTGTANLFFATKSLCGYNMSVSSTTPSQYIDTLNPAYPNNIARSLPTFVMHGAVDALVPEHHADSIIHAITTKFNTTPAPLNDFTSIHKMKKYSNCNHGWGGGSCNRNEVINDVISWLSNHL